MSVAKKLISASCIVAGLVMSGWMVEVDAQRRRAVRRPSRPPVSHVRPARRLYTGVWSGPRVGFYSPYYYSPFYDSWRPYPHYGALAREVGSVRIETKPVETEVYVDGYYAGVVDSYDGFFQRLHLPPGEHEISLRHPGYRGVEERFYLAIGSTYHIKHEMERLVPGEANPSPPVPPEPMETENNALQPLSGRPLPVTTRQSTVDVAENVGFGTLAIRVQPFGALVFVDGEQWLSSDGELLELVVGEGRHRLEVRSEGHHTYVTDVDVRRGQTMALNVRLTVRE